jgi:UDP-N-acetylglucosamine 2-epimerase (non-hydrolysing)
MKIILVAGARPNFMKIAPLMHELTRLQQQRHNNLQPLLVHTGQHYDISMSEVFFRELGIPVPDINLEVGSQSHAKQTAAVMDRFEDVCLQERPDWVVVVGDVNSTMACTLVASKLGIRVAHVEAGLRSFDRTMPEEINRIVTDALADLLLTPSRDADANLRKEGIPDEKIELVGNIMIDTLAANLDKARQRETHRTYGLQPGQYVYVTLHRPANVDEPDKLGSIMKALEALSRDFAVLFPAHPRTRSVLKSMGYEPRDSRRLRIIEPVGYHDSICLVDKARFVLTDSGGLQEESTYLRVPCLTLRPNTERPVTLTQGSNRLTSVDGLQENIQEVLGWTAYGLQIPELWDGGTATRIAHSLMK